MEDNFKIHTDIIAHNNNYIIAYVFFGNFCF